MVEEGGSACREGVACWDLKVLWRRRGAISGHSIKLQIRKVPQPNTALLLLPFLCTPLDYYCHTVGCCIMVGFPVDCHENIEVTEQCSGKSAEKNERRYGTMTAKYVQRCKIRYKIRLDKNK